MLLVIHARLFQPPIKYPAGRPGLRPADPKRVDPASEGIGVGRSAECCIQIPVDVEADRRAVSHDRDVCPCSSREYTSSLQHMTSLASPYLPARGLPSQAETIP